MSASILVAYASSHGSTQEVAEAIAATLRERGWRVDVQSVSHIHSLVGYRAIVLGAPIYMGHWHKDMRHFLAHQRVALTQRPVAVFALGPLHRDEHEWQAAREQFDTQLARVPWLTPIALEVFGGKLDPSELRFPWSVLSANKQLFAESDVRDWPTIRAWANTLAAVFQPELSLSSQ
jgi:menaquinone-dependent protoporphyrinogen oxidase